MTTFYFFWALFTLILVTLASLWGFLENASKSSVKINFWTAIIVFGSLLVAIYSVWKLYDR